ncbi:MAG: LysM peptidoglycan-binding domain-containing protein [Actinomycetota bacterium]
MSAALVDQVHIPAGRAHLRLVVDNGPLAGEAGIAAAAVRSPVVLTARGRWVARILGVLLGSLLAVVLGVLLGLLLRDPAEGPTSVVTVETGESLWSVASAVAAPGEDLRDVVERIVVLNGLDQDVLQPGQHLVVPAR